MDRDAKENSDSVNGMLSCFSVFCRKSQCCTISSPHFEHASGYWDSGARGINSSGQIIGSAKDSSGKIRPVMWDSDGVMHDLGTFSDYHEGVTFALNDSGWIAGCQNDGGYSGEATAWSPDGDMFWFRTQTVLQFQAQNEAGRIGVQVQTLQGRQLLAWYVYYKAERLRGGLTTEPANGQSP